jgi:phenylpyruvate tautomerase PptA (4-oxalocrotonate tautomerase family)
MPIWLRVLLARLAGQKVERHTLEVKVAPTPGQTSEDRTAMAHEIEAEVARQLSEGNNPETTKAAIEEIARRHGGEIKGFKDN